MGSRRHLKRLKSPRHWPIPRKEKKMDCKTFPGPHSADESLPLLIIIRDVLGLADTAREAKRIIHHGEILVDGRPRKDHKFPLDLWISQKFKIDKSYRVLIDKKGRLYLHETKEEERYKLCKILNKTTVKGGKIQLNLHDGRNHLVDNDFKTGDVIKLRIPDQEILDKIEFKEGNLAFITGGKHVGEIARVEKINIIKAPTPNTVILKSRDGKMFETIHEYVFMIGEKEPVIPLPEG